jgi:DNA-binding XRE family transcriptional regulator
MKWLGEITESDLQTLDYLKKRIDNMPATFEIKQARLSAGLTQQAAADLVGVSIKSWQAYEGGWRNIRPSTWSKFKTLTLAKSWEENPVLVMAQLLHECGQDVDWEWVYKAAERLDEPAFPDWDK